MYLSKPAKLIVGVLTVWPFIYLFLFFGFVFASFFWMVQAQETAHSAGPPRAFLLLFAAHFATMLEMMGLLVFYVVYLFKTDRIPQDKKALWAVVLLLGNMLAMPVFYYLYVWPDQWPRPSGPASNSTAPGV